MSDLSAREYPWHVGKKKARYLVSNSETMKKSRLDPNESIINAKTPQELAQKLAVDPAALINTINNYNKAVPEVDAYGNPIQKRPLLSPLFALALTPRVIFNYGGLKINSQAKVISQSGNIIPGLFAAGDNTIGICGPSNGHNAVPSYMTGCGNMAALVFGRIAGKNAAIS